MDIGRNFSLTIKATTILIKLKSILLIYLDFLVFLILKINKNEDWINYYNY